MGLKSNFTAKIGILGGGQLARMLVLAGHDLGFEMHVFSAQEDDPAAQVCRNWHKGDIKDTIALTQFFMKCDLITIESEFLDEKHLLEAESHTNVTVQPRPRLIAELQDRLKQKAWLERNQLTTSEYVGLQSQNDLTEFYKRHSKTGIVIKQRRFGYDGYGTFIIRSPKALNEWLRQHGENMDQFIAEKRISFKREMALTLVRSLNGNILSFPLVEWKARDSKCYWVKGPLRHANMKAFIKNASLSLKKSEFVGSIAFELFDTGKYLIVNEVAPRVHNSAHYSIEATHVSQFAAHLLAIMGHGLPVHTRLNSKGFAMLNLVGASVSAPQVSRPCEGHLHWYGKTENRPGRKMGHVTVLDSSPEKALNSVLKLEKCFKL